MTDSPNIISLTSEPLNDIRLSLDEDIDYLDFYLPDTDKKTNIKKLISPYQDNAFSEEVLLDVVNERLGFDLSLTFWGYINDAFTLYWDEEVGIGGCIYEGAMFVSIRRHLIENNVFCPDYILKEITAAIEDFTSLIPGAYLDVD